MNHADMSSTKNNLMESLQEKKIVVFHIFQTEFLHKVKTEVTV